MSISHSYDTVADVLPGHFEEPDPETLDVSATVNRAGAAVTIVAEVWSDAHGVQYTGEYRLHCTGCGEPVSEYHPDPFHAEQSMVAHASACGTPVAS